MRIVFLGTSHGVPEAHQRCSSTMIEVGDRRYFIDMGTQVMEDLRTRHIPIDSVAGVFITHMHSDHTDGLVNFCDLLNWYFKTANPVIQLPETDAVPYLLGWLAAHGNTVNRLTFDKVKEGVTYEDEAIRLTAYRTRHGCTSYAYLLEAEGRRVLFTGDLCGAGPHIDFPRAVLDLDTDLIICEGAHFAVTEYLPIFREAKGAIGQVVVNHYAPWNLPHIASLEKELAPIPVIRALDGMELSL